MKKNTKKDVKEMIDLFKENDGNGFETIEIETLEDGIRMISFGTYFYTVDGDEPEWRRVDEGVEMELSKFMYYVNSNEYITNADEYSVRPCDDICDLTFDEAVEQFTDIAAEYPYISNKDITMDIPDGKYLSQLP